MATDINGAIIYLPENKLDNETKQLVKKFSESEVFDNVRVMPDCHASSYCCVGMTCQINNKVIPQIVGGDIGCGISCYNLNKVIKEKQYSKYDDMIKKIVPMGERNHKVSITTDEMMEDIYNRCNQKLEILKNKIPEYPYNDFKYNHNYYKNLISRAKSNVSSSNYLTSMGTLGGGNH